MKKTNQGKSLWKIALGRLLHNGRGKEEEGGEGRSKIKNGTKTTEELEKARATGSNTTGDGTKEDHVTDENKAKEAKKTKKTSVRLSTYLLKSECINCNSSHLLGSPFYGTLEEK